MKDGITTKELMDMLATRVLYRTCMLEGKCKHKGTKTNPAYCDITKAMYGREAQITNRAVTIVLHELEKKGYVVGEGGYYCRGTHGGAGAKKWKITDKG